MSATCGQCAHPFDGHQVVATTGDPTKGGIILCPVKECTCFSTWDVSQLGTTREDVFIPSQEEIDQLRKELQT